MTFQLDTTGTVSMVGLKPTVSWGDRDDSISWSDLAAFTQGYIGALFGWARENVNLETARWRDNLAFSDLAPETLARIIADCERYVQIYGPVTAAEQEGRAYWTDRQAGRWKDARFLPLTVQLGDDGKVRFA